MTLATIALAFVLFFWGAEHLGTFAVNDTLQGVVEWLAVLFLLLQL